ncbi:Transposable element Tcb2 transposase, partial [Stegodyphus mimosarum]
MDMEWPAQSPDLNPIEHVWNALGRHLAALNSPPQTLATLATALQEQWLSLPMELIDRVIESITHCCIASRGNHIPYSRFFSYSKLISSICSFYTCANFCTA